MFQVLTDAVDNALAVGQSLVEGGPIERRQVAKLLADGMTIAAVAAATGVAVDLVREIAEAA